MIKILIHVFATAGALLLIAKFVPGIEVSSFYIALLAALCWGLMSVTVRPVLGLLTLPINMLTLGLFSFVLNALLFWLLATVVPGFGVAGFIPALEGSVILLIVSWGLHAAL